MGVKYYIVIEKKLIKYKKKKTMGQQRVSNIALINIEREYANSVLNNYIDLTIDIFGRRNGTSNDFLL